MNKVFISDTAAEDLMTAMLKDSSYEFEGGVREYIESEKRIKKLSKKIANKLTEEFDTEEIKTVDDFKKWFERYQYEVQILFTDKEAAQAAKQRALRAIKCEYLFLNGERNVKPPIDGRYVMHKLIENVLSNMSEEEYDEFEYYLLKK